MFKFLWCLIVGHVRWGFTPNHPLFWFQQDPSIGTEIKSLDICKRCNQLFVNEWKRFD